MGRIVETSKKTIKHSKKEFEKKLLSIIPHLHPYVKHRIYIAESTGILPSNMYCSNGIIDDAIVSLHNAPIDHEIQCLALELKLFKIADELIDMLYIKEGWHLHNISTSEILKEELDSLEEDFYAEADDDLIMSDGLNDISYHHNQKNKKSFIYDDANSEILKVITNVNSSEVKKKKLLGKFYSWLPLKTSNIIDLFVFGKLNFEEIATVKNMSSREVKEIIIDVRKRFRRNLI
ncbi:hypothetical protein ACE939_02735 [Aquimarina sp. W85]|uniref:hypothetical protein n=1 Tax=Aquimarina rhodophyticola TaxID=3342246 RepID=UPI00366F6F7F